MNTRKRALSILLCLALIASMALCATGCSSEKSKSDNGTVISLEDGKTYGEGANAFTLSVVDTEGKEITVTIQTDEETVGAALLALGLIAGEDSEFGLYVKTVNGITLDYEKDGKYWAFYIDGEYAMTGVDSTEISADSVYTFKAE